MEDIRICIICEVNELLPRQDKYCSRKCYLKAVDIKQILRKKLQKPEPKRNPIWTCPNGHKVEIKFDIKKHKSAWTNFNCPVCQASTKVNDYDIISV